MKFDATTLALALASTCYGGEAVPASATRSQTTREIPQPILLVQGIDATAANVAPFLTLGNLLNERSVIAFRPSEFRRETPPKPGQEPVSVVIEWHHPGDTSWHQEVVSPQELGAENVNAALRDLGAVLRYATGHGGGSFDVFVPSMPNFSLSGIKKNQGDIERWVDTIRALVPDGQSQSYATLGVQMQLICHSMACPQAILVAASKRYREVFSSLFMYDPAFGSRLADFTSLPFVKEIRVSGQPEVNLSDVDGIRDLCTDSAVLGEVFSSIKDLSKKLELAVVITRSGVPNEEDQKRFVSEMKKQGLNVSAYDPRNLGPVQPAPPGYNASDHNLGYITRSEIPENTRADHGVLGNIPYTSKDGGKPKCTPFDAFVNGGNADFLAFKHKLPTQFFGGTAHGASSGPSAPAKPTEHGVSYLVASGAPPDFGDWNFVEDEEFPGWILGYPSQAEGLARIYLWLPGQSADAVAEEIAKRNQKEFPSQTANVVAYGDPNSKKNQELRRALNAAGYSDDSIRFVDDQGNLYAADGSLLASGYVNPKYLNSPTETVAAAVLRVQNDTGTPTYGVIPVDADVAALPATKKFEADSDSDNEDNDNHPPGPPVTEKRQRKQDPGDPPPSPLRRPQLMPTPPAVKGVSFRSPINTNSFKRDESGGVDALMEKLRKQRPGQNRLDSPVK
jgi:hypothetical protein